MSQSQKILAQMLALVLVAGGLGAYAWFGVLKKDEVATRQKDHDLRLFAPQKLDERQADGGSPPAQFTRLSVTTKTDTSTLELRGKDWWLTAPVEAKADRLVIDGLLSQLQTAKFKDTLEEDPDAATLKKYGLDTPEFIVEASAQVAGETRSVKLVGGKENTFDGSVYVRRNAEKPVFTAEGGVRYMLAKTTFELRDKTPFAIDETKLLTLNVKSVNNAYGLKREGKLWNFTSPNTEPADAPSVTAMISAASGERAQSFPTDDPTARKSLGFDSPLVDLTATFEGDASVRLRVSRTGSDGGEHFYGIRDENGLSTLAELGPAITQYDRNPTDLRDRTIVRFKKEMVSKIVFHDPALPEVVVQKDAADASTESWRVIAPRAGKAKVFKITGALWTLGAFKALSSGEEKPKDWGRYGIDGKSKFIAVFGDDGAELARLTIGKEVPDTPSGFYVRGTRQQVFVSDGSRFGEFPFALADALDEPRDSGVPSDAGTN